MRQNHKWHAGQFAGVYFTLTLANSEQTATPFPVEQVHTNFRLTVCSLSPFCSSSDTFRMCYPREIGSMFVRDQRIVRAEMQAMQAKSLAHGAATQAVSRVEQDNFDALHCLPVEELPAFNTYDRSHNRVKTAVSPVDYLGQFRKGGAPQDELVDKKAIAAKRKSLDGYDPMQWMKEEHHESETLDGDEVSGHQEMKNEGDTSDIAAQYCSKPGSRGTPCALKKSKWRRRDIGKHLEGEKRRRKARMNRLYILRDLLPKRSSKSTVNGILMDAIDFLKSAVPREEREEAKRKAAASQALQQSVPKEAPHATLKRGVEPAMVRTGILSSSLFPSLLLDQHGNIVESSTSLSNLIGYPCVLNDMPFMAMLHPDDANDLAQHVTLFQSWLTPADLITSHAAPLRVPMRCTVRFTNYSPVGVSAIPVDIELLPVRHDNTNMMLVIILNHPQAS